MIAKFYSVLLVSSFVALVKYVNSTTTKYNYHVEKDKVIESDNRNGIPSESKIECALICVEHNCCSASFNEQTNLCFVTPSEYCFDGMTEADEEGWSVVMKNSQKVCIETKVTWQDAQTFCRSMDGRLATIRNDYEYYKTVEMLKGQSEKTWIGGTDVKEEGVFVWEETLEKVIMAAKYWHAGEPNNVYNDDCLAFYQYGTSVKLNNSRCEKVKYFFCEISF